MDKKVSCAFLLLVKTGLIFGYPYAQLIPLRSVANTDPALLFAESEPSFNFVQSPRPSRPCTRGRSGESTCPCTRSGRQAEPTCPCMRGSASRQQGSSPTYQLLNDDYISPIQIGEISIPQRVIRSAVDTGMPVIESVQLAPSVDPFAENDSTFMNSMKSTLLDLVVPFLSSGQPQIASPGKSAPVDNSNPSTPANSERTETKDCPTHGYGMYYTNLQVQSFSSTPEEVKEGNGKKAQSAAEESREKKIDEQQSQILDYLDQLSQGQMATMMAQLDTEMMAEQEFILQESYLREIKHQLNSMRAAAEARDKLMANSRTTPAPVKPDPVEKTATSISDMPDTTSAVPTTESVPTESPVTARAA